MPPYRKYAVLYTAIVFVAGAVAGALVMNLAEHFWIHPGGTISATNPRWNDADRAHYVEKFKAELKLTDEQCRQLEKVLDETMRQYDDLHSFSHHIREEGLTRIRAMLNEEQLRRFDEITKRMAEAEDQKRRKAPR